MSDWSRVMSDWRVSSIFYVVSRIRYMSNCRVASCLCMNLCNIVFSIYALMLVNFQISPCLLRMFMHILILF